MDLKILREQLDALDSVMKYILAQRMSIIPLVAEYKIENNLPFFQPQREEEMFEKMRNTFGEMGLNPDLIHEIYILITNDAKRIQNEVKEKGLVSAEIEISVDKMEMIKQSLDKLKEFTNIMNEIKNNELESGNTLIEMFTGFYRNK